MNSETTVDKSHAYIPYVGVVLGTGLGSLSNLCKNASFFTKDCIEKSKHGKTFFGSGPTCAAGPYGTSILTTINKVKQKEISTFALATPFIPLIVPTVELISKSITQRDQKKPFYISIPHNIGKELVQIPISRIAHQSALVIGSLVMNTGLTLLSRSPASPMHAFHDNGSNFDVSGHVILKIALSTCLVNSLESARKTAGKTQALAWAAFAAGVAASDAVMMYNTGENCHTVAEVLAGVAAAGIVHVAASKIERAVEWYQTLPAKEKTV